MPTQTNSDTPLSRFARVILWFVAVNALIGAGSLLLFPSQTDTLFFWEIKPPINAALFGALYLGGAFTVGYVTYRGFWEQTRFLVPILVTAGFFISLTTLMHLDRFTPGIRLIYWLIIYIGAPLLALLIYVHQERVGGVALQRGANWMIQEPVIPAVRRIAMITGVVVLLLGTFLLISPTSVLDLWPWQVSPLMIRIFASWFNAFGVGLLWFYIDRDWQRVRLIAYLMMTAAVLDLAMAFLYRADWASNGLSVLIFCLHLVAFGLAGLAMVWLQRRA
ncbi:MAG TPA: hypothetical protein VHL11_01710, partial [Phototrophicaceae bacterium]|nr:hypothetical protein [Phototrophicaceae bacterium]